MSIGQLIVTKDILLLLLFAVLMIVASFSMIRSRSESSEALHQNHTRNFPMVFLQGVITGVITGLIGAGGGFLVIPALVHWLKLPMKTAVGTSLVIIAVNSLAGFFFSMHNAEIHWHFLMNIAVIAAAGILIGSYFSTRIDARKLKPAFGWFVLAMGFFIIIKETLIK